MATQINNTASAVYGYTRGNTNTATSNTVSTTLASEYDIIAEKASLNLTFREGENITYYVTIKNTGTGTLYNVTINDDLGGDNSTMTYIDSSGLLNLNGVNSPISPTTLNPLKFTIPTPLESGGIATITYIARVSSSIPSSVTEITNTVAVQANEGSSTGEIISVSPSPTVTLPLEEYASISMTKTVSSTQINVGQEFSYTITLSNSGNSEATNVVITDTLPENFAISSITSETGGIITTFSPDNYTVDPSTNTLTLPSETSPLSINVPPSSQSGDGETIVTITGAITSN